ncbi:MAG TPA: LysM peptidoglycan-binding domain-containing protein [Longimicrobiales bacterium]|nr:LysM peptidoglycan-binding domain-containing protein [Longimicrobiales bacterium]
MNFLNRAPLALLLAAFAAGCAGGAPHPGTPTPSNVNLPPETPVVADAEMPDSVADAGADSVADVALGLPEGVDAADFGFPLQYNDRVRYWLEYYQRSHDRFAIWLTRMARYEPFIREQLAAHGLPSDLIYLALIESGFSPNAYSRAKAVGIWQFMAETARMTGLEVGTYIDERRDPVRSTEAAVRHLRGLYQEFGSWYLAAAAYNSGSGRVGRALEQVAGGARGDDSLFWRIDSILPAETRNYVPQLLAASILAKYPGRFGFDTLDLPAPDTFEVVTVRSATDLAAIARAADVSESDVRLLNPQFYRGVTPPGRTVEVRLPAGHAARFAAALDAIPARERVHPIEHVVARGESLAAIARRYGVSVSAIKRFNHIKRRAPTGRHLEIPLLPAALLASADGPRGDAAGSSARKGSGASASQAKALASAGRRASRSADDDAATDADAGDARGAGAAPQSPRKDATEHGSSGTRTYRVRRGDTLGGIARDHDLSLAELRDLNHLGRSSLIHPGQELVVRRGHAVAARDDDAPRRKADGPGLLVSSDAPSRKATASRSAVHVVVYKVQAGDSVWKIAREHGCTPDQVMRWNDLTARSVLRPGDRVELHVSSD